MDRTNRTLGRTMLARIEEEEEQEIPQLVVQEAPRKRNSVRDSTISPKKPRYMGVCRMSQRLAAEAMETTEAENLNIPNDHNIPIDKEAITADQNIQVTERSATAILQETGLSDIIPNTEKANEIEGDSVLNKTVRPESESSETQLGSLDRTRVSLGDSEQTTDSRRFIRDEWGTEGTMIKILNYIRQNENLSYANPVTVETLIEKGPVISGYRRMIAARCFCSILKLKQHGFIRIVKDPKTLEIRNIILGPSFDPIS